jgi:hypothetical protein
MCLTDCTQLARLFLYGTRSGGSFTNATNADVAQLQAGRPPMDSDGEGHEECGACLAALSVLRRRSQSCCQRRYLHRAEESPF